MTCVEIHTKTKYLCNFDKSKIKKKCTSGLFCRVVIRVKNRFKGNQLLIILAKLFVWFPTSTQISYTLMQDVTRLLMVCVRHILHSGSFIVRWTRAENTIPCSKRGMPPTQPKINNKLPKIYYKTNFITNLN